MKSLGLCVLALVSFGFAAMIVYAADDCEYVEDECNHWGTGNPLIQGACCVDDSGGMATKDCIGMELKDHTRESEKQCGKLVKIISSECSQTKFNDAGCGGLRSKTKCSSKNCT